MTVDATIHRLPTPGLLPSGATVKTVSAGGDFTVTVTVRNAGRWPMLGGQGDYQPEKVLLVWTTEDGSTWTFRHAILTGRQIDARTGEPTAFPTSQTLYLGDPHRRDCEPEWLADLVEKHTPGGHA